MDEETALAEMKQRHKQAKFDRRKMTPRLFVGMRVRLNRVLDLTDGELRRRLGVSLDRMCDEQWERLQRQGREAITQVIARLAWERSVDGLIVPSAAARPRGANLVIFPDVAPKGWADIYNKGELPLT